MSPRRPDHEPVLLLPPSEGKAEGGRARMRAGAFAAALRAPRDAVAEAFAAVAARVVDDRLVLRQRRAEFLELAVGVHHTPELGEFLGQFHDQRRIARRGRVVHLLGDGLVARDELVEFGQQRGRKRGEGHMESRISNGE